MTLAELRKAFGQAVAEWKTFQDDHVDSDLSDDDQKTFDGHAQKVAELKKKIERAEQVERELAASALPVDPVERDVDPVFPATPREPIQPTRQLAEIVLCRVLAEQPGERRSCGEIAAKRYGQNHPTAKGLLAGDDSAGGILVPTNLSSEVIEYLRPRSAVLASGARVVPLPNGNLTIPRLTAGATGGYIGESQPVSHSEQTLAAIVLTAHKCGVFTVISNDLIRFAMSGGSGVEQMVQADLEAAIVQTKDAAFLRSTGSANSPRGLLYQAAGTNRFDANGTVNLANVTNDLGTAELKLMNANIPMVQCGWIMAPRSFAYLRNLRDANGNLAFEELSDTNPTLRGYPVRTSTQVPTNLGGGGDESEVYFADFAQVLIGQVPGMSIEVGRGAAYELAGVAKSGLNRDETVVQVIEQHDLAVRHPEAVAVIEAVTWTP